MAVTANGAEALVDTRSASETRFGMDSNRLRALVLLTLVRVGMGFQFPTVTTTGPQLQAEFGLVYQDIGTLVGLFMMPGILLALPSGLITRYVADSRVIIAGQCLMVVGTLISGFGTSWFGGGSDALFAGRLVTGIGVVPLFVILTKMMADWFTGHRLISTALAIFLNGWPLGWGIGLLVQPLIAAAYGWEVVFHVAALVSLIPTLGMILLYRDPPGQASAAPSGGILDLSRWELVLISGVGILWGLWTTFFTIVASFSPSFLAAFVFDVATANMVVSINMWVTMAIMPFGGAIADWLRRPTTLISVCLLFCSAVSIAFAIFPWTSVASLIAIGVIGSIPAASVMALSTEVLRANTRGPGMGVFYIWYYGMNGLLPPIAGWTRDTTELPGAPLVFAGFMMLTAALVLFTFRLGQEVRGERL